MTAGERFTFRTGGVRDVEAMFELDLLCFDERFRFDRDMVERLASDKDARILLAECDASLAGFAIATLRRGRRGVTAYLATLDVKPELQRQGIATELLGRLERELAMEGVLGMVLHVSVENTPAMQLYERNRYNRGAPVPEYYGPGLDAWTYAKRWEMQGMQGGQVARRER